MIASRVGTALAVLGLACSHGSAQTFEVASVKRSAPNSKSRFDVTQGGGLNANINVSFLLVVAYNVKSDQFSGAPGWIESEHYAIAAQPPASYTPKIPGRIDADMQQMLRALLAERFKLVVHRESPEKPCYVLVVAKNGPKLKDGDQAVPFKLRISSSSISNDGGAKIAMLASVLGNHLERPVFDETGLTGSYKFDLKWAPDPPAKLDAPGGSSQPVGPSLFTALEEQLGLKLEAKRRPVEILVIDHVERPSAN